MTNIKWTMIAGKFDPIHSGHIDHIKKAAALGHPLLIVTHMDKVVAANSKKGYCCTTLADRVCLLQGYLNLRGIKGDVIMAADEDGTVAKTILYYMPTIFAKGGDRSPSNMPANEIAACREVGCQIVYGIGDLKFSSSTIMQQEQEEGEKR